MPPNPAPTIEGLIETIRDPVLIVDAARTVVASNQPARGLFGAAVCPTTSDVKLDELFTAPGMPIELPVAEFDPSSSGRSIPFEREAIGPNGATEGVSGYVAPCCPDFGSYAVYLRTHASQTTEERARMRELRLEAEVAVARRTAGELHDGVLQSLAAIGIKLAVIERLLPTGNERLAELVHQIAELVQAEHRELRLFVDALKFQHPLRGQYGDIRRRLEELITRIAVIWECRGKLDISGSLDGFEPDEERALLRIVQEAMVNAARHGRAEFVQVCVNGSEHAIRIIVSDDGGGFPFEGDFDQDALTENRLGPVSLKRRVLGLDGRVHIRSRPEGSTLTITIPRGADQVRA